MSYEPTIWEDGDVITSDKLNKIENGILTAINRPAVYIVNMSYDPEYGFTSDKTAIDIINAIEREEYIVVCDGSLHFDMLRDAYIEDGIYVEIRTTDGSNYYGYANEHLSS